MNKELIAKSLMELRGNMSREEISGAHSISTTFGESEGDERYEMLVGANVNTEI